jgi:hypothetical protein
VKRTHYRDLNKPVSVDFTFHCSRCSKTFKTPKPARTCFACRAGALDAGESDPELIGEMSGV